MIKILLNNIKKIILFFAIFCFAMAVNAQSAYYGKINKYSNLYRLPSSHSAILVWLPVKTTVFVISDVAVNGFVQVIYLESGVEGYIYRNVVDFTDKVADEVSTSIFSSVLSQHTDSVTLTVTNNTNRTLTLKIDNHNYTVVSDSQERITLAPGVHKYILFGPKFLPMAGTEILQRKQNYNWKISAMRL